MTQPLEHPVPQKLLLASCVFNRLSLLSQELLRKCTRLPSTNDAFLGYPIFYFTKFKSPRSPKHLMSRPAIHVNVGTSWGPIKKIFRADPLQEHKSAHGEHQPTVVKIDGWDTAAGFHFIMSFFLENSVHIFLVLARVLTTSWRGEYAMWLPPKDPRPSTHGRFTIASPRWGSQADPTQGSEATQALPTRWGFRTYISHLLCPPLCRVPFMSFNVFVITVTHFFLRNKSQ